ncbi:MAG: hypothetical protein M0Z67_17495 [Nitrospiraceae bacterium]|nr:hypothetical protein [Nitrospiraceae bacterium]
MTDRQLREYCEAEFENIDAVLAELELVILPEKTSYTTAELAAAATFIHNCYNGVENVLKRICAYVSMEIKASPTWHKDLIKASLDRGIIDENLYNSLSIYLSFRHFFVHSYSFSLRWEELEPLVVGLEEVVGKFKAVIKRYLDILRTEV